MRSAMARFLTVNDFSGSPPVPRGNHEFNLDAGQAAVYPEFGVEPDSYGVEPASYGVSTARGGITSTTGKNRNDQGPCLYFGPQGQRCSRPALGTDSARATCPRNWAKLRDSAPQPPLGPTPLPLDHAR